MNVVVEHRHLGLGAVLTPVGGHFIVRGDNAAALEEIANVVQSVIVERVGVQCHLSMYEHYIVAHTRQLVQTVVIHDIAYKTDSIALDHADVAEGVQAVGCLVEKRTVAVHEHVVVTELHIAYKYLRLGIYLGVMKQTVGVQKIDSALGLCPYFQRQKYGNYKINYYGVCSQLALAYDVDGLSYPTGIHKLAIAPALLYANIGAFLLLTNPVLDKLLALLLFHCTLEDVEVFCN